jgi:hypothetical protein
MSKRCSDGPQNPDAAFLVTQLLTKLNIPKAGGKRKHQTAYLVAKINEKNPGKVAGPDVLQTV